MVVVLSDGLYPWGNACVECDNLSGSRLVGIFVLTLVLVLLAHWIVRSVASDSNKQSITGRTGTKSTALKVSLFFVQTVALIGVADFLDVFALDFFGSAQTCFGRFDPLQKLVLPLLMPFCSFLYVPVLYSLQWGVWRSRVCGERVSRPIGTDFIRTSLALLLFTYNTITKTIFSYLNCREVMVNGETVLLVSSSPSVECSGSEYEGYRGLMVLLLITHVIGLPLATIVYLARYRCREMRRLTIGLNSGPLVEFLIGPYRGNAFCELVVLLL